MRMNRSTETAVIEEETVRTHFLENNLPVYRSVHILSFQLENRMCVQCYVSSGDLEMSMAT